MALSNLNPLMINAMSRANCVRTMADRIGSGFAPASDHTPATDLSSGHLPLPRLPEPKPQVRSRQAVPDAKSVTAAGTPTGSVGSTPGATDAVRLPGQAAWASYPRAVTRTTGRWRVAAPTATAVK